MSEEGDPSQVSKVKIIQRPKRGRGKNSSAAPSGRLSRAKSRKTDKDEESQDENMTLIR